MGVIAVEEVAEVEVLVETEVVAVTEVVVEAAVVVVADVDAGEELQLPKNVREIRTIINPIQPTRMFNRLISITPPL